VRFLIDAQLPPALARTLTAAGHEAAHVEDVGLREAEDSPIWHHAAATGAVLVTKDEDFIGRSRQDAGGPVVVWLRIGNASNRALEQWFLPLLDGIVKLIESGEKLVEVR
jgi:predicted nuclease of predicted toxin-antitoxin system